MVTELTEKGALRPSEAATWLSCSRDTLDRLIKAGQLRSFKIGAARYISLEELRRFIRQREAEEGA